MCPNCSLLLVEASSTGSADLLTAMQTAANLGADQISDSWSITATSSPFPTDLVTAAGSSAEAPAVFAASGDEGTDPLGEAEFPAALPTVTAVGGHGAHHDEQFKRSAGLLRVRMVRCRVGLCGQ